MNAQTYFPAPFEKCKCTKTHSCDIPCRTNGVAVYQPGDTFDDEDNQTFTYLYCFQQHPMETWEIPIEELDTNLTPPPTPPSEPVKAIVVGVDEPVKTSFWNSFLSELKTFTKTIVRKRNNYGKRPDISLENAAKLTGLTVDQLRTVEKLDADQQMGYPGRKGDNLAFAEKSLIMWAQTYRSAKQAEKTAQKGLAKPIHSPTL